MFSKDLSELLVLALLEDISSKNEEAPNAYILTKKLKQIFGDIWKASPGTVYPMLEKLVQTGDIHCEEVNEEGQNVKKSYQITDSGREKLQKSSVDFLQITAKAVPNLFSKFQKFVPFSMGIKMFSDFFDLNEESHQYPQMESANFVPSKLNMDSLENTKTELIQLKQEMQARHERQIKRIDERIKKLDEVLKILQQEREKNWVKIPIDSDD